MKILPDELLDQLSVLLEGFEQNTVESMVYVKRTQGWTLDTLGARFSGIEPNLLKRYFQPHYSTIRPLHFIAAFSWLTMLPMTSFYRGANVREEFRGMDSSAIEALINIGRMPHEQFDVVLKCIHLYLDDDGKKTLDEFEKSLPLLTNKVDREYAAPSVIDLKKFGESYYRALAKYGKEFRAEYGLSKSTMAKVLGLSSYSYSVLEDEDNPQPLSILVGARMKLGFQLSDHFSFTQHMIEYREFHKFRGEQHARDMLLVESLRRLPEKQKPYVVEIIKGVATAYANSLTAQTPW
ncbi:hypothetical protein MSP8887_03966 [Marinomonas spartinae]|uniref:hypothetical protein n=1 Tax=Marinomonas spartinae TaxID=1792290 RepID=UPI000808CB35|nr:hypothetical protein [Marinomonas spartinae]SBS39715.1 hypothetical protein MSP8887_03966 [Marinomonas spartinae]